MVAAAAWHCCAAKKVWPTLTGRRYALASSLPAEDKQLGGFSLTHWLVVLVIILIVLARESCRA
jgi:hypothetical protein